MREETRIERVDVAAGVEVEPVAAALGDHRGERLGHDQRLEQLVCGHRREALELRVLVVRLLELVLELAAVTRALELSSSCSRLADAVVHLVLQCAEGRCGRRRRRARVVHPGSILDAPRSA